MPNHPLILGDNWGDHPDRGWRLRGTNRREDSKTPAASSLGPERLDRNMHLKHCRSSSQIVTIRPRVNMQYLYGGTWQAHRTQTRTSCICSHLIVTPLPQLSLENEVMSGSLNTYPSALPSFQLLPQFCVISPTISLTQPLQSTRKLAKHGPLCSHVRLPPHGSPQPTRRMENRARPFGS